MPSRVLFVAAISTARNELANTDRLAIVGTESDRILDFGEIEEGLAAKLTDDDIRGVLLSVDAVNRLKRLMLTGCINVTGAGLEPLRSSSVIEQIDLSAMETSDSDYILPILNSIIEQERCALKHLEFPRAWHSLIQSGSLFQQFILRYNEMWARRQDQDELICFECSERLPQRSRNGGRFGPWVHDVGGSWIQSEGNQFGIDRHTCYGCLKHYCRNCESESGDKMLGYCDGCDRMYCTDCTSLLQCGGCAKQRCSDCALNNYDACPDCGSFCCDSCSCNECGFFCYNCNPDEDDWPFKCEGCHETLCGTCRSQSRSKGIELCNREYCHLGGWCNGCRVNRILQDGEGGCNEMCCCHSAISALQERFVELTTRNEELTNRIEELTHRNEDLANRNADLANRNAELTNDNNQLRGKVKSLRKFEGESDHEGVEDH